MPARRARRAEAFAEATRKEGNTSGGDPGVPRSVRGTTAQPSASRATCRGFSVRQPAGAAAATLVAAIPDYATEAPALEAITPATLSFRDGALYSETYQDIYASIAGGLAETRHVFLEGNDLPARFRAGTASTIVETGFGAGLNFLSTWQAFRHSAPVDARLHYVSVEKNPFRREDLRQALAPYPPLAGLASQLIDGYPPLVSGYHRLTFDAGRVNLMLLFGDAEAQLAGLEARADAFFLDGFAPSRNPAMWSAGLCRELRRMAAPGATLATYSVAAGVRDALAQAGFVVGKRPGYGSKREMLAGRLPGEPQNRGRTGRHVAIVGGGIAGSHCALALARHGHAVTVFEAGASAAAGASANPAGLVRPFLSLDRGARSHFSLAAYLHAVRHYRALALAAPGLWAGGGVLQLARDAGHAAKLERTLSELGLPDAIARGVDARQGSALCAAPVGAPGVWFEGAGVLSGPAACEAALAAAGDGVALRAGQRVARIDRSTPQLQLLDAGGALLAVADEVVLANGHAAAALIDIDLGLRPVRGQVSLLPARDAGPIAAVCQEGYVTPAIGGVHYVGATFAEGEDDTGVREADHLANIARAQRMLPQTFGSARVEPVGGWCGLRCVSRDRRPVLGPLAPALHACLALGSRGFTWAPLAAEILASGLVGAPLPVPRDIAAALAPARLTRAQPQ
jgi:tRNA 5-methylaminomethyl-2-thiouridine biosynthesis bifunctional protein